MSFRSGVATRWVAGVLVVVLLAVGTTGCKPKPGVVTWRLGSTHGVVIEKAALRGSLNIYRNPRAALMGAWTHGGIQLVMDVMWHFGAPPKFEICKWEVCYSTNAVRDRIHGWIYGDPWDLKGALFAAQDAHNCLALTIISGGVYNKNWTNKSVGCAFGSVGVGAEDAAPTDPEYVEVDGAEPVPADDYVPGSNAPMPGPPEPVPAP